MFKKILSKFNIIIICFVAIIVCSVIGVDFSFSQTKAVANCPDIFNKFIQILSPTSVTFEETASVEPVYVHISGRPVGFSIDGGGLVVVSLGDIKCNGEFVDSPCKVAGIREGDIIIKAEGEVTYSGERLIDIVNSKSGAVCNIEIIRNGEHKIIPVKPIKDDLALSYRIGVWVRDSSVGVGTITYVTDNGLFSALGHPVSDADTSTIMPVGNGSIYKCSIVGVKKGTRGTPGELKGLFLKNNNKIGVITENSKNGIKGVFNSVEESKKYCDSELVEVANRSEVKTGKASIISSVDGTTPSEYSIEIIKTNHINSSGNRCMVIRITDEKLLNKTNGIVQGMSGSPVVQKGKLIGCVTHVFINDPTKGFAEFISL